MEPHFAAAGHNYHFVPADTWIAVYYLRKIETVHMLIAAGCWRKFATEHKPFVEHRPPAALGRLAFEAEALEAQLLQQEPELPVVSRLAVVEQPLQQQELELEWQDARFFDAIEPGCWP